MLSEIWYWMQVTTPVVTILSCVFIVLASRNVMRSMRILTNRQEAGWVENR